MRIVQLHGGPRHGETASVEDGRTEFVIIKPNEELSSMLANPSKYGQKVPIRTGRYTQVTGQPGNFEWVGWEPSK